METYFNIGTVLQETTGILDYDEILFVVWCVCGGVLATPLTTRNYEGALLPATVEDIAQELRDLFLII